MIKLGISNFAQTERDQSFSLPATSNMLKILDIIWLKKNLIKEHFQKKCLLPLCLQEYS